MNISFNAGQSSSINKSKANGPNKNQDVKVNNKKNYIVYMKTDDMLYSGGNGTGLSFTVKYADNSSKENPIVTAKGIYENGKEFEKTFNINDIDMTNASYVEMHALEGHLEKNLKIDRGRRLSTLPFESGQMKLNDKADFVAMYKESIDMNLNRGGSRSLGLLHIKNLKIFSDFVKENTLNNRNNTNINDMYLKESSKAKRLLILN